MWWQPFESSEDPARSNWVAAFISLRELDILWLAWSQIAESTDTWPWQSTPCLVAYPIVSWLKATRSFCHPVKMLNVEWHARGSCTWTNVKKRAKETSFHKANGYEWSSASRVHCWTWTWCSALTTLPYFDPTVTASHKTWHLTLCYCSLRPAKCCNLFPSKTSKQVQPSPRW